MDFITAYLTTWAYYSFVVSLQGLWTHQHPRWTHWMVMQLPFCGFCHLWYPHHQRFRHRYRLHRLLFTSYRAVAKWVRNFELLAFECHQILEYAMRTWIFMTFIRKSNKNNWTIKRLQKNKTQISRYSHAIVLETKNFYGRQAFSTEFDIYCKRKTCAWHVHSLWKWIKSTRNKIPIKV